MSLCYTSVIGRQSSQAELYRDEIMKIIAKNEDTIVYSLGNSVGTDKRRVLLNASLDDHYSNKYTNPDNIKTVVINPAEILAGINAKLTHDELYVLNNMCKIV